eukprot:7470353-Karenia_brevis.AAC.1
MATYAIRGKVAKLDGGRGITNIHVPNVIIIDNSTPSALAVMKGDIYRSCQTRDAPFKDWV